MIFFFYLSDGRKEREREATYTESACRNWIIYSTIPRQYVHLSSVQPIHLIETTVGVCCYTLTAVMFSTQKKIRTRRNARGENERSQRKEKKTWWFQWQIEEKMRQLISRRRRKKTSSRPRFSSRFLSPYRSGFSLHVGLLFFFLFAYCPAVSFLTWKGNKSRKADNKNLTPNQSNGWSQ